MSSGFVHRYCNFIYSLLGIETQVAQRLMELKELLQFHLLPIRDWNTIPYIIWFRVTHCNFIYSLLGIETTNLMMVTILIKSKLQFHLLPIRDWNKRSRDSHNLTSRLQFHLLPIRDWNIICLMISSSATPSNCNFIYSLLGIETTFAKANAKGDNIIAISFTPY